MYIRRTALALAVLSVIGTSPAVAASNPPTSSTPPTTATISCSFYVSTPGSRTHIGENVSQSAGSLTWNMRTSATSASAPGGLFTFVLSSDPQQYKKIYATRTITYRTSRGLTSTIKRAGWVNNFDPARGVAYADMRVNGTFVSQTFLFDTDSRHRSGYYCWYPAVNA